MSNGIIIANWKNEENHVVAIVQNMNSNFYEQGAKSLVYYLSTDWTNRNFALRTCMHITFLQVIIVK